MFDNNYRVCLIRGHRVLEFLEVYNCIELGGKFRIHEKTFWGYLYGSHPDVSVPMDGAQVRMGFSSVVSSDDKYSITFSNYNPELRTSKEGTFTSLLKKLLRFFNISTKNNLSESSSSKRHYSFYKTDYHSDVLDLMVLVKTLREDHPEVFATFSKSIEYLVSSLAKLANNDQAYGSFHSSLEDGVELIKEYYRFAIAAKEKADVETKKIVDESIRLHNQAVEELTAGMKRINSL